MQYDIGLEHHKALSTFSGACVRSARLRGVTEGPKRVGQSAQIAGPARPLSTVAWQPKGWLSAGQRPMAGAPPSPKH